MISNVHKKQYQGHTLIDIIKASNGSIRKIAEIGVFKARTIKRVLRACHDVIDEYWGVDPWHYLGKQYGGKMGNASQEDWDKIYAQVSNLYFYFPKLKLLRMSSEKAAEFFVNEYFDLIFIDGDHRYEAVKKDIELWLPKVKVNGILSGHDYGARKFSGVTQAVDERFGNNITTNLETYVWVYRNERKT